jgi:hypothetical protein
MKRTRVFINGFEWWIDESLPVTLFETKEATEGTSLFSNHVTPNERTQVTNQLKYDNDRR